MRAGIVTTELVWWGQKEVQMQVGATQSGERKDYVLCDETRGKRREREERNSGEGRNENICDETEIILE